MKKWLILSAILFLFAVLVLNFGLAKAQESSGGGGGGSAGGSSGSGGGGGSGDDDPDDDSSSGSSGGGGGGSNDDDADDDSEDSDDGVTSGGGGGGGNLNEATRVGNSGGGSSNSGKGSGSSGSGGGGSKKVEFEIEEETGDDGEIKQKIKFKSEEDGAEIEFESELEIEEDDDDGKIKAKLSDGNKQEIKIMPDTAFETAIDALKSQGANIELIEVRENGKKKAVYLAEGEKNGKFLGLIKVKVKFETEIDTETGSVIKIKKKWWAFLVSGENDDETGGKITLCHVPPGNPANAHTITIGAPAAQAHMKHGDYLGECKTGDGNETIPDNNQTVLEIEIISPEAKNYSMNDILVNISSNGDLIWFMINNGSSETYNSPIVKTFANGTNTLNAYANDSNGTIVTDSVVFFVNPLVNNTEENETLFLNITSPQNITYTTQEILMNVSTNADAVWIDDGVTNETYTVPFFRNFTNGSHMLIFYGNNTAGNIITDGVTFTVEI